MLIIFLINRYLSSSSKSDIWHSKDETVVEMDEKNPAVKRKIDNYLLPALL